MITINESMTSKTVTDFSLGAQWSGMVSAVALMGLYARRVWKKKSLFTGAFTASSLMAFIFTDSLVFVSQKDTGVLATFVLDKNAGDIDCSRPAMIVHYSKGVPTDWRCPTSIMLMAYSSYPFYLGLSIAMVPASLLRLLLIHLWKTLLISVKNNK